MPEQMRLFEAGPQDTRDVSYPDGTALRFEAQYLARDLADTLLAYLEELPGWRQDHIRVYGKVHAIPRLHRWFADGGRTYRWSGLEMHPEPFPEVLGTVRRRLEEEGGVTFNSALANLYRDGRDSVSWHADDEPELGPCPIIASLSLGAPRRFILRRKGEHRTSLAFDLTHGSLLWMSGATQSLWEHCIPKVRKSVGRRINLTFRVIRDFP